MSELREVNGRAVPRIQRGRLWWDVAWIVEHPHRWRPEETVRIVFWEFDDALAYALERGWEG